MNATDKKCVTAHLLSNGFRLDRRTGKFDGVGVRFRFAIDEVVLIVFVGPVSDGMVDFEVRIPDAAPLSLVIANIDAALKHTRRNTSSRLKIDTNSIWWVDGGDTTATGGRMGG